MEKELIGFMVALFVIIAMYLAFKASIGRLKPRERK